VVDRSGEAELRETGLAQRDQAGGEVHPREVAVVPLDRADEGVGPLLRGHPGHVDVVLDEGGHPGEEAGPRVAGLHPGAPPGLVGQGAEVLLDLLGAGDGGLHDLGDGDTPGRDRLDEPHRVELGQDVLGEGVDAGHGLLLGWVGARRAGWIQPTLPNSTHDPRPGSLRTVR
jgi:hypothetical protein